ncbi:hypothetical protein ALC56_11702 [Trachymyrmex septentrionalis]|uniref:Uncharacterized protein n=1 Tax=Trachymyrmex septentrionalis TaxID=34720 RepID=A0A195F1B0_9HYME|nr:hypothetical protein ALC56_11702 [Trachymyrmex septentrionalis]
MFSYRSVSLSLVIFAPIFGLSSEHARWNIHVQRPILGDASAGVAAPRRAGIQPRVRSDAAADRDWRFLFSRLVTGGVATNPPLSQRLAVPCDWSVDNTLTGLADLCQWRRKKLVAILPENDHWQKEININIILSMLPETSTRVTFQIIDNDNWSTHLVFGTDFLSQNDLTLIFKPTDRKSEDNLKLINEVLSADIIEKDDFPIALTEIKTDFGHDVDKRTYNSIKESYDTLIEKREELELVTLHLAQRQFDIRICSSEVCMDRTVADL